MNQNMLGLKSGASVPHVVTAEGDGTLNGSSNVFSRTSRRTEGGDWLVAQQHYAG